MSILLLQFQEPTIPVPPNTKSNWPNSESYRQDSPPVKTSENLAGTKTFTEIRSEAADPDHINSTRGGRAIPV